jgi:hypothetical protein
LRDEIAVIEKEVPFDVKISDMNSQTIRETRYGIGEVVLKEKQQEGMSSRSERKTRNGWRLKRHAGRFREQRTG